MSLNVEWSIRAEPVSLFNVAKMFGDNPHSIKQMYRAGDLGPAPDVRVDVAAIPLYHVAALLAVGEARKQGIAFERLSEILPQIAGSAYVRFQLEEIGRGRCDQRGGTPSLNNQLWALLRTDRAREALEERLPGGPASTKRYACFTDTQAFACDDPAELDEPHDTLRIIDAWKLAAQMQQELRGYFLSTYIE